jgi:plasmid stability protein
MTRVSKRGQQDMAKIMAVHIRNFPTDLHRELKIQAAIKGVSMKDLIIKYCEAGLRREKAKKKGG